MKTNLSTKGDIFTLKINGNVFDVIFSHWEKKHGNGNNFYATDGKMYNLKYCI